MTEVFSLIDSSLLKSNPSQAAGEEEKEEEDDDNSLTETPVQTPTASSPNSSLLSESFSYDMDGRGSSDRTEQDKDRRALRISEVSSGSPHRDEAVMEAARFQRAADVLARHYGGGSFTRGARTGSDKTSPGFYKSHKTSYAASEEEEEIKV